MTRQTELQNRSMHASVTPRQPAHLPARRHARGNGVAITALMAGVVVASAGAAAGVLALDWRQRQREASQLPIAPLPQSAAERQAVFLARSTLLALQHANVTQDYRVLWQLSAPAFQASNPPQRLADVFAEYRRRRMDLSIAALSDPHWSEPTVVGADGQLRLKGYFPVGGRRLVFSLAYVPLDGVWRMTGISVSVNADEVADTGAVSRL